MPFVLHGLGLLQTEVLQQILRFGQTNDHPRVAAVGTTFAATYALRPRMGLQPLVKALVGVPYGL